MNNQKFARICLFGKPNAGKSTLFNQIIEKNISIVTHKINTTRNNIRGIVNQQNTQLVFIDTPGFLYNPQSQLEKKITCLSLQKINQVDFLCIVIDVTKYNAMENIHLEYSINTQLAHPPIIILNKIDLLRNKNHILSLISTLQKQSFHHIYLISAIKNQGILNLKNYLFQHAPQHHWQYQNTLITDQSLRMIAQDITREKLYLFLHQEIPYSLTVETESWIETKRTVILHQKIFVLKESQKGIILRAQGKLIKRINILSRNRISQLLNKRVSLYLRIKVQKKWIKQIKNTLI